MQGLRLIGAWVLVFCLSVSPLWAGENKIPKSGDKAWDAFIVLQNDWTHQLHDLVVEKRKEFKDIADLSLDWRMAEMGLDTMKFQYLLKNRAESIQRDKGLPAFVTLEWFPEFTEKLQKADAIFKKIEHRARELKQKVEAHAKWQALQDYLKEMQKSDDHKKRFDKFLSEMNAVQKILAKSAADQMRAQQ